MEKIGAISDRIVNNMPDLKKTYSMTTTTKWVCLVCNGEIESISKEEGEVNQFMRLSFQTRPEWPNLKDIVRRETICSLECYKKKIALEIKEKYDRKILGIPIKYRTIEADKKLVSANYGVNLFITGKSGSGKTVLAAGIVKECIRNNMDYKWISYPQFIMELQNMYRKDNESPFDRADEIANFSGLLVIDDLGAEKMTDWVRQISYFIINEREQRCLPILITSNFSLEQMAEQIDVRISSRIAGMSKSIKLSNNDRRLENVDKKWKDGEARKTGRYLPGQNQEYNVL